MIAKREIKKVEIDYAKTDNKKKKKYGWIHAYLGETDPSKKENKYTFKTIAFKNRKNCMGEMSSIRYLMVVDVCKEKEEDNAAKKLYLRIWQSTGEYNEYTLIQTLKGVSTDKDLDNYISQFRYTRWDDNKKEKNGANVGDAGNENTENADKAKPMKEMSDVDKIEKEVIKRIEEQDWNDKWVVNVSINVADAKLPGRTLSHHVERDYSSLLKQHCSYDFLADLTLEYPLSDIDTATSCVLSDRSGDTAFECVQNCTETVAKLVSAHYDNSNHPIKFPTFEE
ncbi:hypothetical protein RFI_07712 [Reticulomyxa filosa]|uniref:Uncharacterized protein n=1 Tax=Reticulomyxa filosa TaxID=46433 RepID=X6NU11_RETFI|nr:hypothetical protein RFI_07712 [Reticulomyxa filosa]|eukprot:ETO29408.1 hypothetical protein RFI_07712 [Reticulomyxa filosa]